MNQLSKYLYIFFGSLSLFLAILGIILPLLPTTPLLLLAAYCYGKSSQTLYKWLLHNRILGKYIVQFKKGGGIPLKAKVTILAILWISVTLSIIFFIPYVAVKILMLLIVIAVTYYILSLKTMANKNPE